MVGHDEMQKLWVKGREIQKVHIRIDLQNGDRRRMALIQMQREFDSRGGLEAQNSKAETWQAEKVDDGQAPQSLATE
jgi:hypothetical protein